MNLTPTINYDAVSWQGIEPLMHSMFNVYCSLPRFFASVFTGSEMTDGTCMLLLLLLVATIANTHKSH